jgi:hypothetical protein
MEYWASAGEDTPAANAATSAMRAIEFTSEPPFLAGGSSRSSVVQRSIQGSRDARSRQAPDIGHCDRILLALGPEGK